MAITSNIINQAQGMSQETRQLNNERKRINSYIRSYERNPKNWSDTMVQQLEMMAAQYSIPFKREIPEASALWNMAGTVGGLADSMAFGIPGAVFGKPYEDESNRQAANIGRVGGSVAQILAAIGATVLTGGKAAPTIGAAARGLGAAWKGARGLKGAADIAKAAGTLGTTALRKGLVGRSAEYGLREGAKALAPYGASRGWQWAKGVQSSVDRGATSEIIKKAKSAIRETDDLGKVVKGANLNKEQIKLLTSQINRKYGKNSKVGKNYLEQLSQAKTVGNLDNVTSAQLVKMANSMNKNWNVNTANVKKLLGKAGANNSDENVAFITSKLREANIMKLDEKAVAEIIKLANKPSVKGAVGLGDINKMQALMATGGIGGAVHSATDWTPSREDLEAQEDPYNPANV